MVKSFIVNGYEKQNQNSITKEQRTKKQWLNT